MKEGHRYLVSGNYKIIYKEVNEGILITDVFDTRQDPQKIILREK
jgi:plasmid stabilization system protein ParE